MNIYGSLTRRKLYKLNQTYQNVTCIGHLKNQNMFYFLYGMGILGLSLHLGTSVMEMLEYSKKSMGFSNYRVI